MAIQINKNAIKQAEKLIKAGEITTFDTNWQEEKPTADEINHYLSAHSMDEYGTWFLGEDMSVQKNLKEHYVYPYGDLKTVQKAALLDTINRAEKAENKDIAQVAKRLLELVEEQA